MSNYLRCPRCERIHGELTSSLDPVTIMVRRSGDALYCRPNTIICRCDAVWTLDDGWMYGRALAVKSETMTDEPASDQDARQNEVLNGTTDQIQRGPTQSHRRGTARR